jgi:hypothetical protein
MEQSYYSNRPVLEKHFQGRITPHPPVDNDDFLKVFKTYKEKQKQQNEFHKEIIKRTAVNTMGTGSPSPGQTKGK